MKSSILGLLICSLLGFSVANAQSVAPIRSKLPYDNTPRPFDYPEEMTQADFSTSRSVGRIVQFGQADISLGRTKVSEVTQLLGGALHFTDARTGYLCYSAPITEPAKVATKRKKKPVVEEPTTPTFQNIWLIVGRRGEISEVRMQQVPQEAVRCPALETEYSRVSVEGLYINQPEKLAEKLDLPDSAVRQPESDWTFWFSRLPTWERNVTELGFLGYKSTDGHISQIISVQETVKGM